MSDATAVTKPKTLEERLSDVLAENIGTVMTAEDVKGIVEKGMKKALFDTRVKEVSGWSGVDRMHIPCLVDELVAKHLSAAMKQAVDGWLAANPEKLEAAIQRAIAEGGAKVLMRVLDERMGYVFGSAVEVMRSQGLLPQGSV